MNYQITEKSPKKKKNKNKGFLSNVIGLESVKEEIRYYMDFIKNKKKYQDWNVNFLYYFQLNFNYLATAISVPNLQKPLLRVNFLIAPFLKIKQALEPPNWKRPISSPFLT